MRAETLFTTGALLGFLYAFARISAVFAFLPLAAFKAAPEGVRVLLALAFTIMLRSYWHQPASSDVSLAHILPGLASEAAIGLAIGLSLAVVLEAFQMWAQVVSLQAGLGYASTIDPTSGADSTVLLTIAQIMAGLLFFVSGADRLLVRALAESLRLIPSDSFAMRRNWGSAMIQLSASIFASGFRLAAPVVTLLLLADTSLAVLGRMQPQLQLISLTMPVKLAATMVVIALTIGMCPAFLESIITAWLHLTKSVLEPSN